MQQHKKIAVPREEPQQHLIILPADLIIFIAPLFHSLRDLFMYSMMSKRFFNLIFRDIRDRDSKQSELLKYFTSRSIIITFSGRNGQASVRSTLTSGKKHGTWELWTWHFPLEDKIFEELKEITGSTCHITDPIGGQKLLEFFQKHEDIIRESMSEWWIGSKSGVEMQLKQSGLHTKKLLTSYHEDRRHGVTLEYEDDILRKSISFQHGKRGGEEARYHIVEGIAVISQRYTWCNDQLQDKAEKWHDNSVLESCEYYDNGKREGTCTTWRDDGMLQSIMPFVHGSLTGTVIRYHRNGRIYTEEQYQGGVRDGFVRTYNDSGDCVTEAQYSVGQIQKNELHT